MLFPTFLGSNITEMAMLPGFCPGPLPSGQLTSLPDLQLEFGRLRARGVMRRSEGEKRREGRE